MEKARSGETWTGLFNCGKDLMSIKYTLEGLEKKIGYVFRDKMLLRQALTHSSFANEQKINKLEDYERLEFLGDAVLELVSSEFLFSENPEMPEGKLTKLRSSMVCEPALAYCARDLELGQYMLLGRRGHRRQREGFHHFRCHGGSYRSSVSGRRFSGGP